MVYKLEVPSTGNESHGEGRREQTTGGNGHGGAGAGRAGGQQEQNTHDTAYGARHAALLAGLNSLGEWTTDTGWVLRR